MNDVVGGGETGHNEAADLFFKSRGLQALLNREMGGCLSDVRGGRTTLPAKIDVGAQETGHNEAVHFLFKSRGLQLETFWRVYLIGIVINECLSVISDQLSSPKLLGFALSGLLLSGVSLVINVAELCYKGWRESVIWNGCWFYYPSPSNRRFGSFIEIFGMISALMQFIFSANHFGFLRSHKDDPIKFSILPLVFAACVACARLSKQPNELCSCYWCPHHLGLTGEHISVDISMAALQAQQDAQQPLQEAQREPQPDAQWPQHSRQRSIRRWNSY